MSTKFITSDTKLESVNGPIRSLVELLNSVPFVATYERSSVGYNSTPIVVDDEFRFDGYIPLVVCPELEHVQSLLYLLDKDVAEDEHSRIYITDLSYRSYGLIDWPATEIMSTLPLETTYSGYEVFALIYGHDFRHLLDDTRPYERSIPSDVQTEESSVLIEIGDRWNRLEHVLSTYCSFYDCDGIDYDKTEFSPFE